MPDRIEVRGLRVLGTHGQLPEEHTRAQPFEIDLDVVADLGTAAAADDLDRTVDYGGLVAGTRRLVETGHFELLETLAARIAELVLRDERVAEVTVAVRKLRPPVAADVASAGVRLTRGRT